MVNAIVYTTNTGHTKQYSELLASETALPVFELKDAVKSLPKDSEIIYLGWLATGMVKGYRQATALFHIKAVCGVGMSCDDSQTAEIRKSNRIAEQIPVFCLQGGFEMEKLHGIYKLMMKTMKATVGKRLSEKPDKTAQEIDMLDLLTNGGNRVKKDNLAAVIDWYRGSTTEDAE